MAHYRMVQVSEKPLSKEDIEYFSIGDNDLSEFYADYWHDEDMHDALDVLMNAFGKSIVKHTARYIVIDREKLGVMLTEEYERWRAEVSGMSRDEAVGREAYIAMHPTRYLSTGDAIYEESWNGYGEHTWDYLNSMYDYRFKNSDTGEVKKTIKLYYGASIDFHV